MKSRKVKAYNAQKRFKRDLPLEEDDSDVNTDDLFHDPIDDLNTAKDNELSTDDELIQHRVQSSDEEVLPITDDEEENFEDEEENEDEGSLPNREAWGKKKSAYYSADFVDEDRGRTYREADAAAAEAEAEEAFAIQKSVYGKIDASNLAANLFLEGSDTPSEDEEKAVLVSATKEEKLKYLNTETEILTVSKEFPKAIEELKKFSKVLELVESLKIESKELEKYIKAKNGVLSLYCMNLSLYMTFASSCKNMKYHPVLQRMASCKKILEDLKSADVVADPIIEKILENNNQEMLWNKSKAESKTENKMIGKDGVGVDKKLKETMKDTKRKLKQSRVKHIETEAEKEVASLINEVKKEMRKRKMEQMNNTDSDSEHPTEQNGNINEVMDLQDEKRYINYKIAKNKGLAPRTKKERRNPRVHHRNKFRKAQIRRKGQVHCVYKEIKRYEGEPTGISTNVVKSIKFK